MLGRQCLVCFGTKKKGLMKKVKTGQFIHGRVFRMHGRVSHAETADTIRLSHTTVLTLLTVVHLAITCSIQKPVTLRTVVRKTHTVVCLIQRQQTLSDCHTRLC